MKTLVITENEKDIYLKQLDFKKCGQAERVERTVNICELFTRI